MPSVSQAVAAKAGDAKPLLNGSDLPKKITKIKIKVADVRLAPENFSAALIIDLHEEVFAKGAWAVNKTNAKALGELLGDNTDKWKGRELTLYKVYVNNPQTKKMVPSLSVIDHEE